MTGAAAIWKRRATLARILEAKRQELLDTWVRNIRSLLQPRTLGPATEEESRAQMADLMSVLASALSGEEHEDIERLESIESIAALPDIAAWRVGHGLTATETAIYLLSLKDALLPYLRAKFGENLALLNAELITMNKVIDRLLLVAFGTFVRTREEVIAGQYRSQKAQEGFSGAGGFEDGMGSPSLDGILLDVADSLCRRSGYSIAELLSKRKHLDMTPEEYDEYEATIIGRFLAAEDPPGPTLLTLLLPEDRRERKEKGNGKKTGSASHSSR